MSAQAALKNKPLVPAANKLNNGVKSLVTAGTKPIKVDAATAKKPTTTSTSTPAQVVVLPLLKQTEHSLPRLTADPLVQNADGQWRALSHIDDVNFHYLRENNESFHYFNSRPSQYHIKVTKAKKNKPQKVSFDSNTLDVRGKFEGVGSWSGPLILGPPMRVEHATYPDRGNYNEHDARNKDLRDIACQELIQAKHIYTLSNRWVQNDRKTISKTATTIEQADEDANSGRDPNAHYFLDEFIGGLEKRFQTEMSNNPTTMKMQKEKVDATFADRPKATKAERAKALVDIHMRACITTRKDGAREKSFKILTHLFRYAQPHEIDQMKADGINAACLADVPTMELKEEALKTVRGEIKDARTREVLKPRIPARPLVWRAVGKEEAERDFKAGRMNSNHPDHARYQKPYRLVPWADVMLKKDDIVAPAFSTKCTEKNGKDKGAIDFPLIGVIWYGDKIATVGKNVYSPVPSYWYYAQVTNIPVRRPNFEKHIQSCADPEYEAWQMPEFPEDPNYDRELGRVLTVEEVAARDQAGQEEEEEEEAAAMEEGETEAGEGEAEAEGAAEEGEVEAEGEAEATEPVAMDENEETAVATEAVEAEPEEAAAAEPMADEEEEQQEQEEEEAEAEPEPEPEPEPVAKRNGKRKPAAAAPKAKKGGKKKAKVSSEEEEEEQEEE